jgi:hypothetical protein
VHGEGHIRPGLVVLESFFLISYKRLIKFVVHNALSRIKADTEIVRSKLNSKEELTILN